MAQLGLSSALTPTPASSNPSLKSARPVVPPDSQGGPWGPLGPPPSSKPIRPDPSNCSCLPTPLCTRPPCPQQRLPLSCLSCCPTHRAPTVTSASPPPSKKALGLWPHLPAISGAWTLCPLHFPPEGCPSPHYPQACPEHCCSLPCSLLSHYPGLLGLGRCPTYPYCSCQLISDTLVPPGGHMREILVIHCP